jgi:hypothetical protein
MVPLFTRKAEEAREVSEGGRLHRDALGIEIEIEIEIDGID